MATNTSPPFWAAAAKATATTLPLLAIQGVLLDRPGTLKVAVSGCAATLPKPAITMAVAKVKTNLNMRGPSETNACAELKRSRIADRGDLIERRSWAGQILSPGVLCAAHSHVHV